MNQTTTLKSNSQFLPIDGVMAGTTRFNDIYGDCYISGADAVSFCITPRRVWADIAAMKGFIEGGDFTGIISMRVVDRNNVDSVKRAYVATDLNGDARALGRRCHRNES